MKTHHPLATPPPFPPAPALVGPRNALAVLGVTWPVARDAACRAGLLPIQIGRARCFRVAELIEALRVARPAARK